MKSKRRTLPLTPFKLSPRPQYCDAWCYIEPAGAVSVYNDRGFVGFVPASVVAVAAPFLRKRKSAKTARRKSR